MRKHNFSGFQLYTAEGTNLLIGCGNGVAAMARPAAAAAGTADTQDSPADAQQDQDRPVLRLLMNEMIQNMHLHNTRLERFAQQRAASAVGLDLVPFKPGARGINPSLEHLLANNVAPPLVENCGLHMYFWAFTLGLVDHPNYKIRRSVGHDANILKADKMLSDLYMREKALEIDMMKQDAVIGGGTETNPMLSAVVEGTPIQTNPQTKARQDLVDKYGITQAEVTEMYRRFMQLRPGIVAAIPAFEWTDELKPAGIYEILFGIHIHKLEVATFGLSGPDQDYSPLLWGDDSLPDDSQARLVRDLIPSDLSSIYRLVETVLANGADNTGCDC